MRTLPLAATLVLFAALNVPPAAADSTCATAPISARSEQSRFEWVARSKARGNWRAKVRKSPHLGAAYADWNAAAETTERCLSGPAGSVCIFTGVPCKK